MKILGVLICILLFSCEVDRDWESLPVQSGSQTPFLLKSFDGQRLLLLWQQGDGKGATSLRFAEWKGEQWGPAQEIFNGLNWFVNWADFPAMCEFREGKWAAHFLEKNGSETYAYGVRLLFSEDGKLWRGPVIPHEQQTQTEHGFVSLISWKKKLFTVWLDGRDYARPDSLPDSLEHKGQMSLRAAQFNEQGKKEKEWLLDSRVCDCCQTSVALGPDGPIVVYRDRSETEVRDIYAVRWLTRGRRFSKPYRIAEDNWEIKGCPVNGPVIKSQGQRVAVLWFAETGGAKKVQLAQSTDGGVTFSPPQTISKNETLGRVDMDIDAEGKVWLSWMETKGEEALVLYQSIDAEGSGSEIKTLTKLKGSRSSGFPRMKCFRDNIVFAWTEAGDSSRIRVRAVSP